VAGIQKLIEEGRIIEPLASFYKDEVRMIGAQLGLTPALLDRHPFPGPGLAIRCLCSETSGAPEKLPEGWILPVRSVGVQGDSRTYRATLAIEDFLTSDEAVAGLINRMDRINRVVARVWTAEEIGNMRAFPAFLTQERLDRLRRADALVRKWTRVSGFDDKVWQLPVVLIPFGLPGRPDSVVLRPIDSVDGMTASVVRMPDALLSEIVGELSRIPGIAGVFYDLTNKPPATIEWE
jgi:GMP synthase (glutamine-hydrolysing)